MGEIKSTLDLVLEKTKHLKLSRQEKEAQKVSETESLIKGLLVKFQDQLLTSEQLKSEYHNLQTSQGLPDHQILLKAIFERIDLAQDNQALLVLLREVCNVNPTGLAAVLQDYQETIRRAFRDRQEQARASLAQEHSISGSAVVPNLEADETWQAEVRRIRREFGEILNREKAKWAEAGG
ncbi:MAG: hypothetical protein JSW39_06710 [Desulfobacterales bacterium]|nr:MAG: hypothetical protein JSW39_06710 [Desulfobacterales bacterium]